jgi:hypothetical protein
MLHSLRPRKRLYHQWMLILWLLRDCSVSLSFLRGGGECVRIRGRPLVAGNELVAFDEG